MSEFSAAGLFRSPMVRLAMVALLLIAGAFYWQGEREAARLQFERDRIASEQAEAKRSKDAEEKRERDRQRLADEIRALKEAENTQRQQAVEARQAELGEKKYAVDERLITPTSAGLQSQIMQLDQALRNNEARQQQYEDENNLRRARADVERQKQYLQQRENEEQMARARRDAAARYGR